MSWTVEFHDEFFIEYKELPLKIQKKIAEYGILLENEGSTLGRPKVDTLNDSAYPNMKELRYDCHSGSWRIAFAFDPRRCAILLVAGDKSGTSETKFYKKLIRKADERYTKHLQTLETKVG